MKKLTVLAAFAAFAAIACSPGDRDIIVAEFADVGDLVVRANVQQSDAVVGTVRSIDLVERDNEWIARVEMRVEEATEINSATTAVVRATSLLGEKYVDLEPGGEAEPLRGAIPTSRTAKAPELEAVFSQLGGILQSGGLEDLARLSSASAMILEGQEDNVGRVLDGTADLVASLASQKDALASALGDLASASRTLADRSDSLDRALEVSADALSIISSQERELEDLVVQLDRIGGPLARLTRDHKDDIDAQLRALNTIVPKLYEARGRLEHAVEVLPAFTELFARAAPGDYVQLDVYVEALPIGTPTAASSNDTGSIAALFLEATR